MRTRTRRPWRNYGRNLSCTPEQTFYPETREDLVEIVGLARRMGKKVRAVGRGHSWSPLATVDDYLVDTCRLKRIGPIDAARGLVTLECGVTIGELDAALRPHGLAVPTNVVLTSVTYGGVLATGCHGAGRDCPTLSDLVEVMTIVLASGEVVTFSEESHGPEVMSAVRLNLGLLGIIHTITLRVEPLFNLRTADRRMPLALLQDPRRLKELALSNDYIEVFWVPFASGLWVKTWNRTLEPARRRPAYSRPFQRAQVHFGQVIARLLRWRPGLMRRLSSLSYWVMVPRDREVVLEAPDALHYNAYIELLPTDVMSFAVKTAPDFAPVVTAWQVMVDVVAAEARAGRFPFNLCLELRVIRSSSAMLSPALGAGDAHHCYFEIVSYAGTPGFGAAIAEIGSAWMELPELQARPHWAKHWQPIPGILPYARRAWGVGLERFARIRERFDPAGMFLNAYLQDVLYGAGEPAARGEDASVRSPGSVPVHQQDARSPRGSR